MIIILKSSWFFKAEVYLLFTIIIFLYGKVKGISNTTFLKELNYQTFHQPVKVNMIFLKEMYYTSKIILVLEAPYSAIFSRKETRCLLFLK